MGTPNLWYRARIWLAGFIFPEIFRCYEKAVADNEVLREGLRAAGWQDGEIEERVALLTGE